MDLPLGLEFAVPSSGGPELVALGRGQTGDESCVDLLLASR